MLFLKKYNITSKNIPLMYVIEFMGGMLFFLPVLALYFEENLFSVTNVALIFSIEAIASALFEIPTGALSDILGRKKVVILNFAVTLLSLVFLLIGGTMTMFGMYAILHGLAMALASGNTQAIIYDSLKAENKEQYYKKVIGTLYAVWPFGAAIGSIVGGYLARVSLTSTVMYSFIPVVVAFLLTFFLREPDYHKSEENNMFTHMGVSLKTIVTSKQLLVLVIGWLILMALGESMHLLKPLFFAYKDVPVMYFGYFTAAIFGLSAVSHYIAHDVSERFGNKKTLIATLLISIAIGLLTTVTHRYVAALLLTSTSLLFGIRNTVIDYLFNKNIPSSHRATINSINSFMSQVGVAFSIPFMGFIADIYTINMAYMIGIASMFVVPVLFAFVRDEG